MGWGDILMAMGEAKLIHESTGQRIVMPKNRVFSRNTYWASAYSELNYIITAEEVVDDEKPYIFEEGVHLAPYINLKESNLKKLSLLKYKPKPADLIFPEDIKNQLIEIKGNLGDFIFIEPHVKASFSSNNKNWGFDNFQQVVNQIQACFVQPDYGLPILKGVKSFKTSHFLEGAALLSIANTGVMNEGGLMHAAAACHVPCAVIFGGFISPENTGYEMHKNFYAGGEPCGSLQPCKHCEVAMKKISPRIVAKKLKKFFQASLQK